MIFITSYNFGDLLKAASEAGGGEPLPLGTYSVVVDSAVHKQTSTGKESINIQVKVEDGPYAGRSVFVTQVLSPENANALAIFFRQMAAMGLAESYFSTNPSLERVAADLTGRRCQIKVSLREWQGQQRNQVDQILPPTGNAMAPAVSSPAAHISPAPAVSAAAAPGPPVPHVPTPPTPAVVIPPPPGDDDLPF